MHLHVGGSGIKFIQKNTYYTILVKAFISQDLNISGPTSGACGILLNMNMCIKGINGYTDNLITTIKTLMLLAMTRSSNVSFVLYNTVNSAYQ